MKLFAIVLASLAVLVLSEEPEVKNDVYILTGDTFDDFVGSHEFVLVEFCKYSCT